MQYLAGLQFSDLFNVSVVVFVDSAVNPDELAILVAMLYARVCVGSQLLGARE